MFNPFRFSGMCDKGEGEGEGTKHQFALASPECLTLGHGKYTWYGQFVQLLERALVLHISLSLGQFFAITEPKTMLPLVIAS
ncbi:hypothetical protein JVU11DRAFT_9702 [Chiua virens]|nr:hypothetical protein JVU11DRAFT_9702 [Chiua virens]